MLDGRDSEQWDEIFRAGTHRDAAGNTHTFTEGDLGVIAARYNPMAHEAPLVVGHPTIDAPAYGWVEKLKTAGGRLYAHYTGVAPEFRDWVKRGLYKKKSVKLYPDMSLRHVGYLGAEPPAIKGLANVSFNEAEQGMCFEFDEGAGGDGGAGSTTADQAAQQSRSDTYGIEPKDGGALTKPAAYSNVEDAMFGDPVNYRYPLDKEHIHAALSYWGKPDNRKEYSAPEQKKITKRMLGAAKKHGVTVDEDNWKFSEAASPDSGAGSLRQILRALRDFIAEQFGVASADKVVPDYAINQVEEPVITAMAAPTSQSYSEGGAMPTEKELNDQLAAERKKNEELAARFSETEKSAGDLRTENERLKAEAAKATANARRQSHGAFCETLVKAGKLIPADVPATLAFMETIAAAGELEFSENGATVKKSGIEAFKTQMSNCAPSVEFSELATKGRAAEGGGDAGKKLSDITAQKVKDGKMAYGLAFAEAQKENPELARQYDIEIRTGA